MPFEFSVEHMGTCLAFESELQSWEFGHRILMKVNGCKVIFELDEERNYRAVLEEGKKFSDSSLLANIAHALEVAFK